MKKKIFSILVSSFSLILLVNTSCEDFVKGVGEFDPTPPRDASLGQVMTSAEVGIIAFNEGDLSRLGGIFTDQFTGVDRQYISLQEYVTTAGDYDSQWDNIYSTALKSLRIGQAKATAEGNNRTLGKAKILEAYLIGMTAAAFGDVPYSQAVNFNAFPNPAYDTQASVYAAVLTLLDGAIANITTAVGTYEGSIYTGNDAAWIARANTLKAKYNLHLGNYATAETNAAAGISTSAQDLTSPHGASYLQDFNIYYSFLSYDRPGYMSAEGSYAARLMDPGYTASSIGRDNAKTQEAARFITFFYPGSLNSVTADYDLNVLWAPDGWGNVSSEHGMFSAEAGMPVVSVAENLLILAEANLRNGDNAGAIAALNLWRAQLAAGYRISPGWLGEGSQYDAYVLADFANDDAIYDEIITEKYVSLVGQLEVFNDMRRMGFGASAAQQNWQVIGVTPNAGASIPQRFLIPQTELNSNTSAPADPAGLFERTDVF